MTDDPMTMLRRAAEQIPEPPEPFDRLARRRHRARRNRRTVSIAVATLVFAAGLLVLLRAIPHGTPRTGPAGRQLPSPVGSAPDGIGSIETIRTFSAGRAVALADHAVLVTTDGGDRWGAVTPPGFDRFVASRMFFLDADHGWVVSVSSPSGGAASIVVFRTADGGRTWNQAEVPIDPLLAEGMTGPGAGAPDLGFSGPLQGWLAFSNTFPEPLFVTTDGGATWHPGPTLDGGPGATQFKSVTFTSRSEGWAVGERNIPLNPTTDKEIDSLLRTTDGGATWQPVDLPPPPIPGGTSESLFDLGIPRFFGSSDGVAPAWAYQDGQSALFVYVTHDGGATWWATDPIPIDQGRGSPIFMPSFVSATTWLVASTSGQIAATEDGGATWAVRHPQDFGPYGPSFIEFSSATDGWAMTCQASSGSMDGDTQCNGPAIAGSAGRYALYRTTDGGTTWTLVLTNGADGNPVVG